MLHVKQIARNLTGAVAVMALSMIAIMPSQALAVQPIREDGTASAQTDGDTAADAGSAADGSPSPVTGDDDVAPAPDDGQNAHDAQQGNAPNADAGTSGADASDDAAASIGQTTVQPESTAQQQEAASQSEATPQATNTTQSMDDFAAVNRDVLSDGTYTFASALSGRRLIEIGGASSSDGASAQTYSDNGTSAQRWRVSHDAKGYVVLLNANSGKSLDIASGSSRPGARVQQYASNGSRAQRWVAVKNGDGVVLHSAVADGIVLDIPSGRAANGVALQTWTANGSAAQRWIATNETTTIAELAKANVNTLPDGIYGLASGVGFGKLLDVENGSSNNGANVQIYGNNHTSAQRWQVTHDANGFVTLINVASGKALDVASGVATNGANVQQYAPNGSAAQKWVAVKSADGKSFVLHSALNVNLVVDVAAGSNANGANVQIYRANGSKAQTWSTDTSAYVRGAIESYWRSKQSTLGDPVANEQRSADYTVQDFRNGTAYAKNGGSIYAVNNNMRRIYNVEGGPSGWLGYPVSDSTGNRDGWRYIQQFEHGATVSEAGKSGVFVKGGIASYWDTQKGINGWLGWPKGNESTADNGNRASQAFDGGTVHAFADGSSIPSIQNKWTQLGGGTGSLGAPADNITVQTAKYYVRIYANGAILSTSETDSSKAFVMDGDIFAYWKGKGALAGFLGSPIASVRNVRGGKSQQFEGGSVYWSASTGAHAVKGAIFNKYMAFGYEHGKMGFPETDEVATIKNGVWQHFQNGSIYWRPDLGTYAVSGGFFSRYANDGYQLGLRGFPTSDEYNDRGYTRQDFEHGTYWWGGFPAGTYSHNVPWYGQPNNYYCAPASGAMMMAQAGKWRSASGVGLSVEAMAQYMHTALPDGTWENNAVNGLNNWFGQDVYSAHGYPSADDFRYQVLHSFETQYAPMVFSYERRGGPHPNGHSNASFGHAMVIDAYDTRTDSILIADPLAVYGGAQKFWYNAGAFRDQYLSWTLDSDPPAVISAK